VQKCSSYIDIGALGAGIAYFDGVLTPAGSFERSVSAPVPYKTRRLLMLLGLASLGLQHNLNDNTLVASVPRAGRRAPTDAPAQGPAR
jgi:hypothetical protein